MARDYDSSIASAGSRSSSADDTIIFVERKSPKLMGMNVSVLLYVFLMSVTVVAVMHFMTVVHVSALKYGWVMTVMFGLLGPISVLFWILVALFVGQGFRVLLTNKDDYRGSADMFRRWKRTSSLLIVSFIATMIQFFCGCFMFVTATSMESSAEEIIRARDLHGWRKGTLRAVADIYDVILSSNYNLIYPYPLNIISMTGRHWATTSLWVFLLPLAIMLICAQAQTRYYNWKFRSLGITID